MLEIEFLICKNLKNKNKRIDMENKETQNIRVVTNVKDIKLKKLREEIANLEIEKENLKFEKFNDSA